MIRRSDFASCYRSRREQAFSWRRTLVDPNAFLRPFDVDEAVAVSVRPIGGGISEVRLAWHDDGVTVLFFVAFSFFRGTAVLQGIAMRAKLGNASGPDAGLRGAMARLTAEIGWGVAQTL